MEVFFKRRVANTRELILPQLPYLIVYRILERLVILNILHGAQKWP
ncbi:MAG: type II toxin-antitoxin system RelE/ParE family toxin [Acidobacteriaceae bacterium]|nr:type II toxin-antitoxin system RelE/ParE family toxin [Acidobacteriaceae bacterium]MBV9223429.1 type II toxin-antitoxin system RelE/ParE family toxin [Acidobacteriaceae bacterium]MBV9304845.1 type II toxin-antitoxin system RelE/ParE family toxin [Acidobacteriaceae bacterium]MBV9675838.1 type II toxin-antitoxin system RelE/ParE family toxin [Acidobacteriaceae bacterium]MBV9939890.1 type II toxin-antitoxin system RelE/ParE family toxin [Acidobacteriaceae bacterium]